VEAVPSWSAMFPFLGSLGWIFIVLMDPWFAISEQPEEYSGCSEGLISGDRRNMKGKFLGQSVDLDASILPKNQLRINSLKVNDQDFKLGDAKLNGTTLTINECQVPECGWQLDLNDQDIGSEIYQKTPLKKICIFKKDGRYRSTLTLGVGGTANDVVLRESLS
jgi:hypothetical protein